VLEEAKIIDIFKKSQALLEGHFLLTSGLHSSRYIQCAQVLQYPEYTAELCTVMADYFKDKGIQTVIGPAMGGIIVSYEVARQLGVRTLFTERENGAMVLRRNFKLAPGEKVLVVEDVVTTGGSVKEVLKVVAEAGAEAVGVGVLVDRSGGKTDFGVPLKAVLTLTVETFQPENCPMCKTGTEAIKPGSRK
jgi:orotate phosphoribosyltransferase